MATKMVEIGKAVRYGWETLQKDFWYFIGVFVLYSVVSGAFGSGRAGKSLGFLSIFVSAWLTGGLYRILLDYKEGKKQEFTVLFTQFKQFWQILFGSLLVGLIVMCGLVLLIVPGIIWGLRYMFTMYFIIDKNMQVMDAMRASAEMTKGIKGQLFLFSLACLGIMILGVICLGVGVFVAMPVVYLATLYIYRSLPAVATPAKS